MARRGCERCGRECRTEKPVWRTRTSAAASGCPLWPLSAWRACTFHDLRHTGNQLTANAGANPKELMVRMGHDSEQAALVYLHSSRERQRALADAVGEAHG